MNRERTLHEGFVHGFVEARAPKTPRDTLLALEEAESAWLAFVEHRKHRKDDETG